METFAITLGQPAWLFGLIVVPIFALLFLLNHFRRRKLIDRIVSPRLRALLAGSVSPVLRAFRALLVLLALACIVLALARPRTGYYDIKVKNEGRDVILCVDVSRSMLAPDPPPSRLERARLLCRDLVNQLRGNRLGIVAFAGSAFLQAPLTLDRNALELTISELDPTIIPRGSTNIAIAIRTAVKAFTSAESSEKAIILISDGEELEADAVGAAREAAQQGIKIFTVGVGSADGSLIPIQTPDGRQDFVRGPDGKPVHSRLDEIRLRQIAQTTGGFYLHLDHDTAERIVREGIEPLRAAKSDAMVMRIPIERYQLPTLAAVLLLVLWLLLPERRFSLFRLRFRKSFQKEPSLSTETSNPSLPQITNVVLILASVFGCLLFPTKTFALSELLDPSIQKYRRGEFAQALDEYERRAHGPFNKAENFFNAGAAAYRLGQYQKAIENFSEAIRIGDKKLQIQSYYNLANSLVRAGENADKIERKKRDWLDAIENYEAVLAEEPNHQQAKENIEVVKKLLEELEKQQPPPPQNQPNPSQQENSQKNQEESSQLQQNPRQNSQNPQSNNDKQQQNQQGQGAENQNQNSQSPQDSQQQEKSQPQSTTNNQEQNSPDQQQRDEQSQQSFDQNERKSDRDRTSSLNQSPDFHLQEKQERKEGELEQDPNEQKQTGLEEQIHPEEKPASMTPKQARALLEALRNEEERVRLLERAREEQVLRDW